FELKPSMYLSQNEIDAAKLVHWDEFNPQMQPRIVWPAAFPVVRSYLDQLARRRGLPPVRIAAIRDALAAAEGMNGVAKREALTAVARQVDGDSGGAASAYDAAKVRTMAQAIRDLVNATNR